MAIIDRTLTSLLNDNGPARLLLYQLDKRIPKNDYPRLEMRTFDICRIHEFVSYFFGIEEEWSEKVIGRIFDEDVHMYQLFELGRRDRNDLGYGIYLTGKMDELRSCDSEIKYLPLHKKQKLSIRFKTRDSIQIDHCELTYEDLISNKTDNSVVALFNNKTFNYLAESTRVGDSARIVKVIDLPSQAKL